MPWRLGIYAFATPFLSQFTSTNPASLVPPRPASPLSSRQLESLVAGSGTITVMFRRHEKVVEVPAEVLNEVSASRQPPKNLPLSSFDSPVRLKPFAPEPYAPDGILNILAHSLERRLYFAHLSTTRVRCTGQRRRGVVKHFGGLAWRIPSSATDRCMLALALTHSRTQDSHSHARILVRSHITLASRPRLLFVGVTNG